MQVNFRLKKILIEQGLYTHGVGQQLSEYLGVHRHTVSKLLNDEATGVTFKIIQDLCRWMRTKGVTDIELPQALFGSSPPLFWQAVGKTSNVKIYLGEYQQYFEGVDGGPRRWISRRDSDVADAISQQLQEIRDQGNGPINASTCYVPFRFSITTSGDRHEYFRQDATIASKMLSQIRDRAANSTSILIGSMEVNYMVEVLVADLFGCRGFESPKGKPRVPVHMTFRHPREDLQSCFGSLGPPLGYKGKAVRGMYYLGGNNKWVRCPFIEGESDAGLVIVVGDNATNTIEVVMFGFTGRATAAMATEVVPFTRSFWPPYFKCRGKDIGVYMCKMLVGGGKEKNSETYHVRKFEVNKVEESVLKRFVKGKVK